jgi:hypothetical protein
MGDRAKRQRLADDAAPASSPAAAPGAAADAVAAPGAAADAVPAPPAAAAAASASPPPPRSRSASPAQPPPPPLRARAGADVVVWDLDETLIVFNSLLDRSFTPVDDAATGRAALPRALPPIVELRCARGMRRQLPRVRRIAG